MAHCRKRIFRTFTGIWRFIPFSPVVPARLWAARSIPTRWHRNRPPPPSGAKANSAMHIVFGVAEYYPLVKMGGLADFAGSFTEKLAKRGHIVSVVLPGYSAIDRTNFPVEATGIQFSIPIGSKTVSGSVSKIQISENLAVYLIENEHYFNREHLFGTGDEGYGDNAERFLFFSRAILELADRLGQVDVFHMNDWHTAIALFYLKEYHRKLGKFTGAKSVLTIHNLGYQGLFWHHDMHLLNMGWEYFTPDGIEFYNHISYLKSGMVYADEITTVSPSYAREIQTPEFGFGLDGVLRSRAGHVTGILNGVDYKLWNPWFDPHIDCRYSAKRFEGKAANKLALQREMQLAEVADIPLVTIITRLTEQKGIDLILPVFDMMMELEIQFVLLGTGKNEFEDFFRGAEHRYKGQVVSYLDYSEKIAHRIQAAGDIYLMPSRYEPCGLSQLYAMKYGNVPLVRLVGGLRDTVIPVENGLESANGFGFEYYSPYMLYETLKKAVELYRENQEAFRTIAQNGMKLKFSWSETVKRYLEIYKK
ncbi:MAG: glycogen synthase GlgA [Acidobacteria bacterium]|nr:MAG: glycogen synthase GlgA [Acidobacteriota bacterium]